jgi:hypothetical protein
MRMLLGHPEADVRVNLGELLLDVRDEREAVVSLRYEEDAPQALVDWRQRR